MVEYSRAARCGTAEDETRCGTAGDEKRAYGIGEKGRDTQKDAQSRAATLQVRRLLMSRGLPLLQQCWQECALFKRRAAGVA